MDVAPEERPDLDEAMLEIADEEEARERAEGYGDEADLPEDEEEEDLEDEDEPDEEDATPMMRQMMLFMKMMDKQQAKRDAKRDREVKKMLHSQQVQHRKTLTALKPRSDIDQTIPLPRRIESDQTITEYLVAFEKIMKERGTPRRKWSVFLRPLLNRKYTVALCSLDEEEADDFDRVKETLIAVDVEDLLMAPRKFFEAQKKEGEDFHRFCQKLETYYDHITREEDTIRKIKKRTVMERFLTFLPHQCATAVRDKKPTSTNAAVNLAKEFFLQRGWNIAKYLGHGKWADQSGPNKPDYQRRSNGGYRQNGGRQRSYNNETPVIEEKSSQAKPTTTPERTSEKKPEETTRQGERKSGYRPTCFACGKVGHTKRFCRSKPDVNLVNYLGYLKLDRLLTTSGIVEGKEAREIALDTGADVCVVSNDLVSETTERCGTQVTGTIGGEFEFPKVVIDAEIQGRKMKLKAVAVPRRYLKKDLLLGKDTPGLGIAWWLNGIEGKETPVSEQAPEHREDPGSVDVGVVTRAQAERVRREIEGLEKADEASEATPNPLEQDDSQPENDSEHEGSDSEQEGSESESELESEREDERDDTPEPVQESQEPIGNFPGNPYSESEREGNPTNQQHLKEEQLKDKTLKSLREKASEKSDRYFFSEQGLLCRQGLNEFGESITQIVLPVSQRRKAFRAAHSTLVSGHLCYKSTVKKIIPYFTWPGLYTDCKRWCSACTTCQTVNPGNQEKAPLQPLPVVRSPWSWIAFDIVGPLHRTKRGNRYLLTCIDLATRYPEAIPVKSMDLAHLIDPLFKILSQHGIPEKVLTDQGTQFTSDLFAKLCDKIGVNHVTTTPYRPQSNGCVERMHKTFKACLRKCPNSKEEWDILTPYVLFALRETPHRSTGFSPFTLMYGRPVRGPACILAQTWHTDTALPTSIETTLGILKDRLKKVTEAAQQSDTISKHKRKLTYDRHATAKPFDIGDKVLVRTPCKGKGSKSQWNGPYLIMDKPSSVTYELNTHARKRQSRTYHRNSLKAYIDAVNFMQVKIATGSDEEGVIPLPPNVSDTAGKKPSDLFSLQHLGEREQQAMEELLEKNFDVFTQDLRQPAKVDSVTLETSTPYPITQRCYQVPEKQVTAVKEEIASLLDQGIIRHSSSPWNSPAVIVRKPNGRIRLCVNYQRLNSITKTDPFPLPNVDLLISKASSSKWISTLDLTKGFHQVPVAEADIPKTSFSVPWGKYEYIKMPFGIKNGPAHFQRVMTALLGNTPHADIYIDDIIVYSDNFQDHTRHLQTVFDILRRHRLRASPQKAVLAKHTLDFLGHRIGSGTISPQEAKIEALHNYNRPTTKKGIRSFLGASGFYRKFIRNYSHIASPLYRMTTKTAPDKLIWTKEQHDAFTTLKTSLTSDSILISPDQTKPFLLCTDASTKGVGGILCQTDSSGRERPIAYFSRKLKPYQRNYSVTELEMLAIILAIQHFQIYLIGTHFTIITDHRALLSADKLKSANGRLARWALFLQSYSYSIHYRPGRLNTNADALSRQEFTTDPIAQPTTPGGVVSSKPGGVDP